jgi:zinc protease
VTPARARELAQRWFGRWQPPALAAPDLPAEAPASTFGAQVLVNLPGAGQSSVLLVSDFSAQGDADRRVGQVANAVLGGGYSARLNQEVRIRRGLAYGASSHAASAERGGMFSARTQTDHRNALQVVKLLRTELARLAEQPPQAEELAARKASLVGGFARQMETTTGLSAQIGELWMQRRPLAGLAGFPTEVESVQSAEVADFARRRWGPAALRVVVVGDLAAAVPSGTAPSAAGAAAEGSAPGFDPQALRLEATALDLESPSLQPPTR